MIHFLIAIDHAGFISDIKWSNPVYFVTMQNKSLLEFFSEDTRKRFRKILDLPPEKMDHFHSLQDVEMLDLEYKINVCILPFDHSFLVFGIDSSLLTDEDSKNELNFLIHKFMLAVKDYAKLNPFHNNETTRFQFEQIQTLNNQLVNTQRMLEKANMKLNELNLDLNNRLVKDALTGLISRYQYRMEIQTMITSMPDQKGIFTFIDIDAFKKVNDTYGHAFGDKYLIAFSERLKTIPIEDKITIRISGDEFGIYVHNIEEPSEKAVESLWGMIVKYVVSEPVEIDGITLRFSISAGMAIFNEDTTEIYDLIEYADFAMYQTKNKGKNGYHQFSMKEYVDMKGITERKP